jgi:hypothetical protein
VVVETVSVVHFLNFPFFSLELARGNERRGEEILCCLVEREEDEGSKGQASDYIVS